MNSISRIKQLGILVGAGLSLVLWLSLASPAAASAKDRNHDRIPDRWEKRHHLSINVKQTKRDQDRDGLNNIGEFRHKSDPRDADTDDDGLRDGREVKLGDDPCDDDSDDDGIEDGDEGSGTITSFDSTTGTLTIALFSGGELTGQVLDGVTEVECDDEGGDSHDKSDEGDDTGDDSSDDSEAGCSSADLVPGAVVHEAELQDGSNVFDKVELGG
jgi:hypothetical protein